MNGVHLIADCYGCTCDSALLFDADRLRQLATHETQEARLTIVGEKFHSFLAPHGAPAGVTCALLLAESHLAIHTWPERNAVTLDVYVCNYSIDNTAKAKRLFEVLVAAFRPERVDQHVVQRGGAERPPGEMALEYLTPHTAYGTRLTRLLAQVKTPYQQVEVADSADFGTVMRIGHAYMTSERDEFFYHECLVHPAALAHPAPRRALIVGGGDGGAAEELLKHPTIEQITLCELDAAVVEIARNHLRSVHRGALDDARVSHIAADGIAFVGETSDKFDLILLDLTDPSTPEGDTPAAGCYTQAFFAACHRILTEHGALVMHLGSPFFHPERFALLYRQLHTVFSTVRPYTVYVPLYGAAWGMAIASNALDPLALDKSEVAAKLAQRRIGDLQYYNAAIHSALFALPNFVQNLIEL